jgi:hypothetical protein
MFSLIVLDAKVACTTLIIARGYAAAAVKRVVSEIWGSTGTRQRWSPGLPDARSTLTQLGH